MNKIANWNPFLPVELPTDNNEEDSKRPRQYIDFHFLLELHDTLKPMLILETNISESAGMLRSPESYSSNIVSLLISVDNNK